MKEERDPEEREKSEKESEQKANEKGKEEEEEKSENADKVVKVGEEKKKRKLNENLVRSLSRLDPSIVTDIVVESGFGTLTFLSSFLSRVYNSFDHGDAPIPSLSREKFERKWMKKSDMTSSFASFSACHRPDRRHVVSFLHAEDDRVVTIQNLEENVRACESILEKKKKERGEGEGGEGGEGGGKGDLFS